MTEPLLLKGEELSAHIDECIETLQFFKRELQSSPDFELEITLQFLTNPQNSQQLNRLLLGHFGDKAVLEGLEAFEEETKFIH